MKINERCSCGAQMEVEAPPSLAESTIEKWRVGHNHVTRGYQYPYVSYGAVVTPC